LAAVLCELCGYKLFLFAVSALKKTFDREDREGNAKIAKKGVFLQSTLIRS